MNMQYQSPKSSSDQEFTYLAVGMVAGAIPGIIIGLLLAIPLGNPAMWVSITGGIGIVIGMVTGKFIYRKKYSNQPQSPSEGPQHPNEKKQ